MQELEKILEEINDWISDYEEENDFGDLMEVCYDY